MLTRIRVAGFKAIPPGKGVELELRPFTMLVGPNGSGKSSVLQAIGVLAQSAREPSRRGLVANGSLVRADPLDESALVPAALLHRHDAAAPVSIEITADLRVGRVRYTATVSALPRGDADFRQELSLADGTLAIHGSANGGARQYTLVHLDGSGENGAAHGSLDTVLARGLFRNLSRSGPDLELFASAADALDDWLCSPALRYVGGWRGVTIVPRDAPKGPSDVVGAFGENMFRILLASGTRGPRLRAVVTDAAKFGMPHLEAGLSRDGELEVHYRDPFNETLLPLEAAGEASQRALPLLVELHHANRGSTLLIDELEGGVHPLWMRAWGETLASAAALGIQVIVTTQSPDLATAVALAAKKKLVSPESVVVYDFNRSVDGLQTTRYELNARGRYSPGFIKSYVDAEKDLLGQVLAWDGVEDADEVTAPAKRREVRKSGGKKAARHSKI